MKKAIPRKCRPDGKPVFDSMPQNERQAVIAKKVEIIAWTPSPETIFHLNEKYNAKGSFFKRPKDIHEGAAI